MAEHGNPEAQYHLGMMYNNGLGVSKNPQNAFEWFRKAAIAGEPLASYKIGCYYGGQFENVVAIDLSKALEYKLVAATAGYSLAQYDVGIAYYEQEKFDDAVRWWKLAADQGYAMALYNLSVIHKKGVIVPKDMVQAYSYFKLAKLSSEKRINPNAQVALSELKAVMSAAEIEKAERMVSLWRSRPSSLTKKAAAGIEAAKRLAGVVGQ
jgi:TPR repeat protein